MYIDDAKWAEIIEETTTGIARWNASAAKHNKSDKFHLHLLSSSGKYSFIVTEHHGGWANEWRALAREIATGEVRSTKAVIKKQKYAGASIKTPDPKAWKTLANKSAKEIVGKTKLLDFAMLISSRATAIDSGDAYRALREQE